MALAIGVIAEMFSYFPYAAAFIPGEGETAPQVDPLLVLVALAVAPFVLIVVGLISRNPVFPKDVLRSMGLLLLLGLAFGLISPALGATAGFGAGFALTLNRPDLPDLMRNRLVAVGFSVVYTLVLLVVATPAGVLTGAILPALMVGFADEYTAWHHHRGRESSATD